MAKSVIYLEFRRISMSINYNKSESKMFYRFMYEIWKKEANIQKFQYICFFVKKNSK